MVRNWNRLVAGGSARLILLSLALVVMAGCGSATTGNPGPSHSPSPKYNPIYGVDFGPWTQADAPGALVPDERIKAQLKVLQGRTTWIKLGGATGGTESVPKLARQMGFKVVGCAFLNGNAEFDKKEVDQLEKEVLAGDVDVALVGNEAVHNKYEKVARVVALLDQVRQDTNSKVPVATVEPAQVLIDNRALIQHSDVVFANITPFSYHVPLDKSVAWIQDSYANVQAVASGKEVRIGETEWPSAGGEFGAGVLASPETQAAYVIQTEAWARGKSVGMFFFEAFDEPWLKAADSNFGPHWGLFSADLALKPGLEQVFAKP